MKVFIITREPFPNGMAATNRIKCYARAIREGGVDCEVIIFKRTEVYGRPVQNTMGKGEYEGVPYQYIGGTPLRNKSLIVRKILDKIDLWCTFKYLKTTIKKGDVLFVYNSVDVRISIPFINIAHNNGAYCIRDLCEIPFGTGVETKKTKRLRILTFKKEFPLLDGIISISDALFNLARTYALPTCKHLKVPIMVDFNQYYLPDESEKVSVPYIFHSGTLYEQKDGILGMIEAFGQVVEKRRISARFICTGNVDNSFHKNEINQLIEKYHLQEKITFLGYLQDDELKKFLSKASLVIINKYRTQQNHYCFSTKLGEYLAAGKPVIITNVGEAMNWLKNKQNAYIIEPGDTNALANTIAHVLQNQEEARMIGISGQKTCQECFDYRHWNKPLLCFFNSLKR